MRAASKAPWLVALVALGVAASAAVGWQRHRVESGYRTVELVVDSEDWRLLAQREGRRGTELWEALRARGAGSVAVYEATLRRLQEEGRLTYRSGAELRDLARTSVLTPALRGLAASAQPQALYVFPGDPEVARQVEFGFRTAVGPERGGGGAPGTPGAAGPGTAQGPRGNRAGVPAVRGRGVGNSGLPGGPETPQRPELHRRAPRRARGGVRGAGSGPHRGVRPERGPGLRAARGGSRPRPAVPGGGVRPGGGSRARAPDAGRGGYDAFHAAGCGPGGEHPTGGAGTAGSGGRGGAFRPGGCGSAT